MRNYDVGSAPRDRDDERGWEVARPRGDASLHGVRMAGFRDRAAAGLDKHVLPRPAVVIVIGLGDTPFTLEGACGSRRLTGFAASLVPGATRVRGERVECVEMHVSPPAAYALLGVSPQDLGSSVTGLDDLWGRHALHLRERLTAAPSWRDRLALMDEFLVRRAARAPSMAPEVAAAWGRIVAGRGRVRVEELAASCGWSRKRLWSRFTDQVGLTPKRAAMLVRFDVAVRALRAGDGVTDVALACGYADQSHLHRDVRAFAGCTPGALASLATAGGRQPRAALSPSPPTRGRPT
ncbi:AraC family transcriptional regulator [Streptomyces sp. NBC_00083]|uniref:helix-turn-helix domain-containing protein n=1 Tax=Streptomyces sp. NBC_00083 TaxID=2975647 RepID=UPI00224D93BB|nr:helix-turn-helix transcriptional regulator [Streptomyces sp. NBC_00083]MCX5384364.1 helix-turn-helix transcriptional regulator [Streptomyces sp. NBC_00083]